MHRDSLSSLSLNDRSSTLYPPRMDPVVDTGFDEGVNEDQINPVQPKTLENDLFPPVNPDDSAAQAPELYPHGATGQLEGAAPVPGSTDIEQLPVPPPKFMMHQQEQQQQEEQQEKGDDQEEEEVEGDDLFGDGDDDDEDELSFICTLSHSLPQLTLFPLVAVS